MIFIYFVESNKAFHLEQHIIFLFLQHVTSSSDSRVNASLQFRESIILLLLAGNFFLILNAKIIIRDLNSHFQAKAYLDFL